LSLASREKLKGSGAISDFEFRVLENSSTALARNLNDDDFATELSNIRQVFQDALDRARQNRAAQNGDPEAPTERSNTLQDAQGNVFDASSLSDEEYQDALNDGLIPQ
jgi:hypothetical protein